MYFWKLVFASRMCASVGLLNLIGAQQLNNLVCILPKDKNLCTWIVQCSAHSKLNAAEVEKLKSLKWYIFML